MIYSGDYYDVKRPRKSSKLISSRNHKSTPKNEVEESDSTILAKEESESRDSADVVNKAIKRKVNSKKEAVETEEPNNGVEDSDSSGDEGGIKLADLSDIEFA